MAFEVIFPRFSPFNSCARLDAEKTSIEIFPWEIINRFWTADSFSFFFSSKQQRVRSQFLLFIFLFMNLIILFCLNEISHQPESTDSKAGTELLDIILTKV